MFSNKVVYLLKFIIIDIYNNNYDVIGSISVRPLVKSIILLPSDIFILIINSGPKTLARNPLPILNFTLSSLFQLQLIK